MKRFYLPLIILIPVGLASLAFSGHYAVAEESQQTRIKSAVSGALPFLLQDANRWLNGTIKFQDGKGCVSCHQVNFGVWSLNAARSSGDSTSTRQIIQLEERALTILARPGIMRVMSAAPLMQFGPVDAGTEPWPQFLNYIRDQQMSDGKWRARGQFPAQRRPVGESDAVATAWTLLGLLRSDAIHIESTREKAVRFLLNFEGATSTEWYAACLLLESAGRPVMPAGTALNSLLAARNADGGWGWRKNEISNAFSTAQVLYALEKSGQAAEITRAASAWLLAARHNDKSWHVPAKLVTTNVQPATDYVYRYWGTAWAVIALSAHPTSPQFSSQSIRPGMPFRDMAKR